MNQLVAVTAPPPMDVSDIERVALAIAKGGLFGSKDPNAILTLCFLAHAEGQHPAVVFRDYHIIQGKPAKKADAMLRDFINAGGKVEWHRLDDECADATFSHPSGQARIDWTLERAKTAGLATPMWKKYPRQMLRSRVISEGVRTVYPGATSGLYEENEIRDIVAEERPVGGQSEERTVSPQPTDLKEQLIQSVEQESEEAPKKIVNWGGRYPTKTALKKAMHTHNAELERLAIEGSFDDLDAYLTSPEYKDYIAQALEHAEPYLTGGDPAPPEYVGTFALESKAKDMIALRGNQSAEQEPA